LVAPLLHSGFFKWFNNQEGTAGYVMVSATNERDVRLVQNVGKAIKIKYQQGAYFQSDHRHVYFNGNATIGLADFSFEIDDAGNPYWIITKYEKKWVSGKEAIGTL
jgi:histidinol phosphatase-like PHP family hydrolase